jgi:hypothetical protein
MNGGVAGNESLVSFLFDRRGFFLLGNPHQGLCKFDLFVQVSFSQDHDPLGLGRTRPMHGLDEGRPSRHGLDESRDLDAMFRGNPLDP